MTGNEESRTSRRVEATVSFTDIVGFTALSEKLDAEAVTDILNRCFAELEAVVLAHGGFVDKYLGDSILSVFGLDGSSGAGARQAVAAALEMRAAVRRFNREDGLPEPLDVHVGIGCGTVFVGEIGGAVRRQLTVTGEAVDLAARLEDLSVPGQILVGSNTFGITGSEFDYRPLDEAEFGERDEGSPAYELVSEQDPARRLKRDSERRQATVVFAEIRGFRALADTMSPEALIALLNRCFTCLESAVLQQGGVVDKYVGETVMALFGAPNAIEDAARQAVNAAIEMRRQLDEFQHREGLPSRLALRIGINTGLVIAGEIGGRIKRDFTVLGDAVNVAARLKDATREDTVLIGPETFRYTAPYFEFRALPPLALKGKARTLVARELVSVRQQAHRTTAPLKVSDRMIFSEFVGRKEELARIDGAVAGLREGRGGIVGIVGEAGMGKSRLMAEVMAKETLEGVTVLEGRSLAVGQGLAFHPFVDLIRQGADIADEDDEEKAAHKLEAAMRPLLGSDFEEFFPFVATLLGARLGKADAERIESIQGEAMEELLFRSMRRVVQCLAEARPSVLIFEDVHWADLSSIKLLETLLRLVERNRLLMFLVGRPDFPDTSERLLRSARETLADHLVEIRLDRLSDLECDALVQNLLDVDDLPFSTRKLIIRKAEGNPFYIEEVIRSLLDQGAVEHRDGRFHLTEKIDRVVIPGTIEEVIMARVDRLDEASRHVLQVASVIGRLFQQRVVAAILADVKDLDQRLEYLEERQLLVRRSSHAGASVRRRVLAAELEYVFKHALVQETIYESILQKTRKDLHRRVAEAIESLFADRLVDFHGMLAYHFSRADELAKAEDYLFKAGEEAARTAASNEALNFFREASRLYLQMHGDGGDPRKKARLEKSIGLAFLNKGDLTESIDHFDAALRHLGKRVHAANLFGQLDFARCFAGVLAQMFLGLGRKHRVEDWEREREAWEILFNRGRAEITSEPTRLFIDTVTGFYRLNQIDVTQIEQGSALYVCCGMVFGFSGISFAVARKAVAIARQLIRPGNVRDVFTCASMEFILNYLKGDWDPQYVVDEGLAEQALRYGQLWDVNTYAGLRCDQLFRQGDFEAARKELRLLAELNDGYGYQFAGANHDGELALLLLEERKLTEALDAADGYTRARHEEALRVLGLGTKAKAQVLLGNLDGAASSLAQAEKITSRSREIPPWHLSAYAVARLHADLAAIEKGLETGHVSGTLRRKARGSMRYAFGIASKVSIQRPEIQQLCGSVLWCLGKRRPALTHWGQSLRAGEHLQAKPELARTYAEIGRRLSEDGRGHSVGNLDASACLARARSLFSELGLTWDLERLPELARRAA